MDIPWKQLSAETLQLLVEEYVSRDGTDYGAREVLQETKVEQVLQLLRDGVAKVVFDPETETCDIREAARWGAAKLTGEDETANSAPSDSVG